MAADDLKAWRRATTRWALPGLAISIVACLGARWAWRSLDERLAAQVAVLDAVSEGADRDPWASEWVFVQAQGQLRGRILQKWSAGPNRTWDDGSPQGDDLYLGTGHVHFLDVPYPFGPGHDLVRAMPRLYVHSARLLTLVWLLVLPLSRCEHLLRQHDCTANDRRWAVAFGGTVAGFVVYLAVRTLLVEGTTHLSVLFGASPGRAGLTAGALTAVALYARGRTLLARRASG